MNINYYRLWGLGDRWNYQEWGRHIRSSPQGDPELLHALNCFLPPWDASFRKLEPVEFHDVVQWLQVRCYLLLRTAS